MSLVSASVAVTGAPMFWPDAVFSATLRVVVGSLGEDRRGVGLVHIRDVDGHVDAVRAAVAVGDRNRHRIAVFRLEVERGAGLELAAGPDDAEVGGVRPAQGVGQRVARVRIRRRDGDADVLARCRVLGDASRGADSLGEGRCGVRGTTNRGAGDAEV